MRLSMPPFVPPYTVLFLVVAYAAGFLWLGLVRLDDIAQQTESASRNAATIDDLQALLNAVSDIDAAGPIASTASTASLAETFEHGRRRVPILLSALRDKVRGNASELALVEELVPLIAERTTLTASSIERRRTAPDPPVETTPSQPGETTSDRIRTIITSIKLHEQEKLNQSSLARIHTIGEARRDFYIMAGAILLLVTSLFLAVRRLRSFMTIIPSARARRAIAVAPVPSPAATYAGVETLLRDALLRARLAEVDAPADSSRRERLRSLVAATEQALSAHADAYADDRAQSEAQDTVAAMALLAQAYSRPEGLTVNATIDRSASMTDARKAFLLFRSAEWALEAITLRKRTGEVTLELVASGKSTSLRIHALTDDLESPVALTPKESEEAIALQQGVTALAGTFVAGEGPTGFSIMVTVPSGT